MSASGIPIPLTSFIGRERETAGLSGLMKTRRLITLTGAGGCGKTRLALWLADKAKDRYPDGVHWVDLASVMEMSLVVQAVARALVLPPPAGITLTDSMLDSLQGKRLLLVLDNCEHLLPACANLVERLLAVSGIHILATSREPFSVEGEALYPVAPLSLPPIDFTGLDLARFDAIRLFIERTQAVLPSFALSARNSQTIVSICRRLDGIPLAIELAASRVNLLSLGEIEARLDDRFSLLKTMHPTIAHHQTLRAAVEWSHDLLGVQEQILLRRVAVFSGTFSLEAAEAVCARSQIVPAQVLDLLASLVNKSLVIAETLLHSPARYRMLETIREFALEKLEATGETDAMRELHLAHFLRLAEAAVPKLRGSEQKAWLNRLELEHDNFRAALGWSLSGGVVEAGMRTANALAFFWNSHGYAYEGQSWLERFLDGSRDKVSTLVRAKSASSAGLLAGILGDAASARKRGQEAVELCQALGEAGKSILASALVGLASGNRGTGEFSKALDELQQAIQLNRELDDASGLAFTYQMLALTAMDLEDYALARESLRKGLELAQALKDTVRAAHITDYLGDLCRCEGKYREARQWYETSLATFKEAGASRDVAGVLHNLAHACFHLGEKDKAESLFRESLSLQKALHNRQGIAECITGFSAILLDRGVAAEAACLLTAVAIHGRDAVMQWPAERMEYNRSLARSSQMISAARFEQVQTEGRHLSLEQAEEFALDLLEKTQGYQKETGPDWGGLTARELEVAALIGAGKSNIEIADELVLSKRTVESHVAHIRSKLGFTNRSQIVRWAVENESDRK
jgi:predicted ATPase/DNA-binding CsgD family transcriptional regulator/Tfp pilus assembly protein PilF